MLSFHHIHIFCRFSEWSLLSCSEQKKRPVPFWTVGSSAEASCVPPTTLLSGPQKQQKQQCGRMTRWHVHLSWGQVTGSTVLGEYYLKVVDVIVTALEYRGENWSLERLTSDLTKIVQWQRAKIWAQVYLNPESKILIIMWEGCA